VTPDVPKWTDTASAWGSMVSGGVALLALIAAGVAAWAAWKANAHQAEQLRRLEAAEEAQQASRFAVWIDETEAMPAQLLKCHNASGLPVYDVEFAYSLREVEEVWPLRTIGPTPEPRLFSEIGNHVTLKAAEVADAGGDGRYAEVPAAVQTEFPEALRTLAIRDVVLENFRFVVSFRDAAGVRWKRHMDGKLTKLQ
jgi:hypothetical protein